MWPTKGGRPLGFLACLDLSEVSGVEWLPESGRLLVFYDIEEQPCGFDPKDRGGWAVQYVPETTALTGTATAPEGLSADWKLPKLSVAFHAKAIAPSWDHSAIEGMGLSDSEEEVLMDLRDGDYEGAPHHQIGGFPDPIQNAEMEMECQLASNGLYLGDGTGRADPRAKALEPGAADWRLLLQFDSDDDLSVMWGDVGMLYFWVREADARRADFSGTWLVLQCH